jgi:hypothetical protein
MYVRVGVRALHGGDDRQRVLERAHLERQAAGVRRHPHGEVGALLLHRSKP